MNIVYFYSEVMGYTLAVIKSLVKDHGANVHVVFWDKGVHTPFELPELEGVTYYKRSSMDKRSLEELLARLSPQLLYISGRMDRDYLKASVKARNKGTLVVSGFDAQWKRTIKNYMLSWASPWLYKKYFDYIWVPGIHQHEFARKMGYPEHKIIWNLLTADTDLFAQERQRISRKFVFTGRFTEVKGISILIEAFLSSKQIKPHDWKLFLIGNGALRDSFPVHEDIIINNFLQPEQLSNSMVEGGVFVLPSLDEPWGVVLHEYAAAGFPLICTDVCGAATVFVKNNDNGWIVKAGDREDLTQAILRITDLSAVQLIEMGKRSHVLSQRITPLIASSSFMSALKMHKQKA